MGKATKSYLNKCLWVTVGIFAIRLLAIPQLIDSLVITSAYDVFGCIGEAIGVARVLMVLYERLFWRINPIEKTPRIYGEYEGVIEYQFNGGGQKRASALIKQSLLSVKVLISTDEITSRSISSIILDDGNESVLIYTYVTHPKSKVSNINPIAYGTCRMSLEKQEELNGTYWTSQPTIGDISLVRKHSNT